MASTAAVEKVGTVVIGAGVIGLAVARSLVKSIQQQQLGNNRSVGDEVLLLERNDHIGAETSSRNSEVVHGGLYYPTNSYKAKFCVYGRQLLYDFCESHGVPYNKMGKLVVAQNQQEMNTTIRALYEQSCHNGYHNVRILTPSDVSFMEPNVQCNGGALWSPETGIVDSHNFMLSLLADAEQAEPSATLILALGTPVEKARIVLVNNNNNNNDTNNHNHHQHTPRVQLYAGGMWLQPEAVVNSAGLWADHVARMIHNNKDDENKQQQWKPPRQYYAKGTYFQLNAKSSPFSHLIYPVPDQRGGLGVHATLDVNNRIRFGPDVEWLAHDTINNPDEINYQPDESRGDSFYDAIRTYWPDLPDNSLTADYTGVRPKLCHPNVPGSGFGQFQDFYIAGPEEHGIPGLVHLFGMESPGLTSCMAIADHVANLLHFRKTT